MAYALEVSETVADGLKRVALEQLDQALASARNPGMERDEAVHDVRKCMKKLRALLRLAREELGEEVFKRENACFRESAQRLSGLREAAVRMATAEKLQTHFGGQDGGLFVPLFDNLQALAEQTRRELLDESDALCEVAAALGDARARVGGWTLRPAELNRPERCPCPRGRLAALETRLLHGRQWPAPNLSAGPQRASPGPEKSDRRTIPRMA